MKMLGCDYLATGHYAQIEALPSGEKAIFTSSDHWKDQTYFLFTIDPKIIGHLMFPVGHLNKTQVRQFALEKNIPVAKKKDSTGICFVGNQSYGDFLKTQVPQNILDQKKGAFRKYPTGEILGKHEGVHLYTYGQSKGFGLTHHEKMFVVKIDALNSVWLGEESHLYQNVVSTVGPHFLDEVRDGEFLSVKVRYSHKAALAKVTKTKSGLDFEFAEPQRAITPGQAAVFYRGQQLVGGSWIC
jgi:tRNA-specific 2-thiouridylase